MSWMPAACWRCWGWTGGRSPPLKSRWWQEFGRIPAVPPWTGIPQSWSCQMWILLPEKRWETIHVLGTGLWILLGYSSGNSWLLPKLVILFRLGMTGPGILKQKGSSPDFPVDNGPSLWIMDLCSAPRGGLQISNLFGLFGILGIISKALHQLSHS